MRSHLLAKVAMMASGYRRGGRPVLLSVGLGRLWRAPRHGLLCAAVLGVATALVSVSSAAAQNPKTPAGMVAYAHPVYKNGKRMLWHGAWRGSLGRAPRQYAQPARTEVAEAATPAPQPQQPVAPQQFSVLADPGDLLASRMAKDLASAMSVDGTQGRAIVGSTSPNGLAKVMRTDMADFAIVSLDSLISSAKADADWMKRAPYVARLAPETVEVIAPRGVKSVADLQGKNVSSGDPDSATATSARMLFSRLGVSANLTLEPLTEGLEALGEGKRDAIVVLGAEGSRAIADFGDEGRFHVVAIPWSPTLEPVYAPARVTARDQPNLVPANEAVETIGEPMALVALDAPPGSPRADTLGKLTRGFLDNFDALLTEDHDARWREVNLASEPSWPLAPWPRLPAAQSWLDAKKTSADASLDAFRASAKSAADMAGGPSAADSDRLYQSLTRWRGLMQ